MTADSTPRVAVITGGGNGIGRATALLFAQHGYAVAIWDMSEQAGHDTVQAITAAGGVAVFSRVDVSQASSAVEAAAAVRANFGRVDVLINNAGIPKHKHVTALTPETADEVMRVNYSSPVRLTLRLLPHMVERGSGRIVMVSSVAATLSSPGEGAYDASKSALSVFSEAMAIDVWDLGIRVNIVYPGVVDTPLFLVPDNDPLSPDIEKIPVDEFVDGMMEALYADQLQAYVPAFFEDIAKGKAQNVGGFIEGSVGWMRQQREAGHA